jgi:peptidoglycan-associated lipoprotein
MIKKLSAILIALSITSCHCYSDLFKKSAPASAGYSEKRTFLKLKKNVFFATDSYTLNAETKAVLDEEVLSAIKGKEARIEGNCDERGTEEYNKILGQKRADAVKDYLVKKGADASKITTVSYGKSRPLELDHDAEAWAVNRRVMTISIVQR